MTWCATRFDCCRYGEKVADWPVGKAQQAWGRLRREFAPGVHFDPFWFLYLAMKPCTQVGHSYVHRCA